MNCHGAEYMAYIYGKNSMLPAGRKPVTSPWSEPREGQGETRF
jgi:hypothetical protein